MRGRLYLCLATMLVLGALPIDHASAQRWQAPFENVTGRPALQDGKLTLEGALSRVAQNNPTLKSLEYRMSSSRYLIDQAGRYPNPEFEAELEDILWDAPGLKEPEITVKLAQELELFGQRGARKAVALAGLESARLDSTTASFDLYLETKQRFYALARAQRHIRLLQNQVELARSIVENIEYRMARGAGLESELLLARLEMSREELALAEAEQDLAVAQASLTSLWSTERDSVSVTTADELDLSALIERIETLPIEVDSSRDLLAMKREQSMLGAEFDLAAAEARPSLRLSGGFRRVEAENSNSFLVGLSLPLPLWNRNQGERNSIRVRQKALEYDMRRARMNTKAQIETALIRLRQLDQRHQVLDRELLPTAESVYQTLQTDYEAGRLPYTSLLEAERTLLQLRQEHADLLFEIQQQVIALEHVTGLVLTTEPARGSLK